MGSLDHSRSLTCFYRPTKISTGQLSRSRTLRKLDKILIGHKSESVWSSSSHLTTCLKRLSYSTEVPLFVCVRPYQHGGDMLSAITLTLRQYTRPDMATPAALALQGLRELCRAEVLHSHTLAFIHCMCGKRSH